MNTCVDIGLSNVKIVVTNLKGRKLGQAKTNSIFAISLATSSGHDPVVYGLVNHYIQMIMVQTGIIKEELPEPGITIHARVVG